MNSLRLPTTSLFPRLRCTGHWSAASILPLVILSGLSVSVAFGEWGGTATGTAGSSRSDSLQSSSVDQQYTLFTSSTAVKRWSYLLSCRYRHLQTQVENEPVMWQSELQPSASLRLAAQRYNLRGEYSHRANRDKQETNELTGQSASGFAQFNPATKLRVRGSLSWSKNVNDLELLGYDTRATSLGAGSAYTARWLSLAYDYSDLTTRNKRIGLDRVSRSHTGKVENTLSAWSGLTQLQTSAQLTERLERESGNSGEALILLPATSGLYADDISPEFGELEPAAGLIDGQLAIPADDRFDLSGSTFHNFGLYFGANIRIDHLHLYTDTLANPGLAWSVWTSTDNQTWTRQPSSPTVTFSPVFSRYEIALEPVLASYIKLVLTPIPATAPVRVTELRALYTRTEGTADARATNRRLNTHFRLSPAKWLNFGVGGDLTRIDAAQTALAREEDGLRSDIRFIPADVLQSSFRYSRTKILYPESTRESATTEFFSSSFKSVWSPALTTIVTLDRSNEFRDGRIKRRNDAARVEVQSIVFPALRSGTLTGYTEDHRFDASTIFYTRFVSHYFDGRPTPYTDLRTDLRYEWLSAEFASVPDYRRMLSARLTLQLTSTVTMTAIEAEQREPGRVDRNTDVISSWTPTRKWTVSAGINRQSGNIQDRLTQWSLQSFFRWTVRTDISLAYSFTDQASQSDIESARIGFNTRF